MKLYVPPNRCILCDKPIDSMKCPDCGAEYKQGIEGCWLVETSKESDRKIYKEFCEKVKELAKSWSNRKQ